MHHWKICKSIIKVDLHVIFVDSRQLPGTSILVVVILETTLGDILDCEVAIMGVQRGSSIMLVALGGGEKNYIYRSYLT